MQRCVGNALNQVKNNINNNNIAETLQWRDTTTDKLVNSKYLYYLIERLTSPHA